MSLFTPTLGRHRNVRRAVLHRFPYSVFYRVDEDVVVVIAIVHQARHPRVWQERS